MSIGRILAAVLAAVAVASLLAQAEVVVRLIPGQPAVALWVMAGFFTIWSNVAVAATALAVTFGARPLSASWHGAVLAWIAVTGLVFHLLLAGMAMAPGSPFSQGLGLWAAQGLHTAVPLLALLFWFLTAPKAGLTWRDALLWLLLPLAYCGVALGQAALAGRAVYPFLDAATIGWGGVARSVAALLVGFVVLHLLIVGLARLLTRAPRSPGGAAPAGPRPR